MYRLLIIDTKASVRDRVRKLINWYGYGFTSVRTASSYSQALEIAVDQQPHVIISGLQLGSYWGYDLARQLRATGVKPVFCLIADAENPVHMRKAMQAGVREYLVRPIKLQPLQEFVERTIAEDFHGGIQQLSPATEDLDPVLQKSFSEMSRITHKIILYIMGNYRDSLSLTAIAEQFNMSSKYIGRVFLRDTGLRFTEYLMAFRMLEARRLIINTQEKISVISRMVGYSQLNNFYTHFKSYYGTSPSTLRSFDEGSLSEQTYAQGVL